MSAKAVAMLRLKTIRAARGFSDHNFRTYFIRHTQERFRAFDAAKASPEELMKFQMDAELKLHQMRRMGLVNTMYAQQMVVSDPRAPQPTVEELTQSTETE
jgi:hypothetical protein